MRSVDNRGKLTSRNAGIDAVRVLGIVAVVVGHVSNNTVIRDGIYTWHVPLFFVLAGYFWTTDRPLRVEAAKRTRTLLLPYAVWLAIISVVFLPWQAYRGELTPFDAIRPLLGGSYIGMPFSAFWFLSALFIAVLLFRSMQRWPLGVTLVVIVASLGVAYAFPAQVSAIPLGAGVALPSLAFVAAGALIRRVQASIVRPVLVAISLLVGSVAAIASGVSAPLDLKKADFGTPVTSVLVAIAISWALILLGQWLLPRLGSVANETATVLASCGTMVILSHSAVLWMIQLVTDSARLELAVALVVPFAAAMLLRRTRLAPFLLGTRPAAMRPPRPALADQPAARRA
jgi:fucose 4-O-acetylase-like acetyltransferase